MFITEVEVYFNNITRIKMAGAPVWPLRRLARLDVKVGTCFPKVNQINNQCQ